jgi:hypothetical protein
LASAGPGKDLKREKNRFQIRLVIKSKPVTARPLAHRLEKIETSSGMIGWAQSHTKYVQEALQFQNQGASLTMW